MTGQKVVRRGLLWLSLGLYMDSMYAHSYLTWSLLHEGGEVNWGPLATDCIQVGLGLQESSTVLQTISSYSRGSGRATPACRNTSPKDCLDFSGASGLSVTPAWQPHLGHPVCLRHTVPREDNSGYQCHSGSNHCFRSPQGSFFFFLSDVR